MPESSIPQPAAPDCSGWVIVHIQRSHSRALENHFSTWFFGGVPKERSHPQAMSSSLAHVRKSHPGRQPVTHLVGDTSGCVPLLREKHPPPQGNPRPFSSPNLPEQCPTSRSQLGLQSWNHCALPKGAVSGVFGCSQNQVLSLGGMQGMPPANSPCPAASIPTPCSPTAQPHYHIPKGAVFCGLPLLLPQPDPSSLLLAKLS